MATFVRSTNIEVGEEFTISHPDEETFVLTWRDTETGESRSSEIYAGTWIKGGDDVFIKRLIELLRRCFHELRAIMMLCGHCNQEMVELRRNEMYVFYKCGCRRHKGVDWDWKTFLMNGVEYSLGTAGSFVHDCPSCKGVTYRERMSNETCVRCGKDKVIPRKVRTTNET